MADTKTTQVVEALVALAEEAGTDALAAGQIEAVLDGHSVNGSTIPHILAGVQRRAMRDDNLAAHSGEISAVLLDPSREPQKTNRKLPVPKAEEVAALIVTVLCREYGFTASDDTPITPGMGVKAFAEQYGTDRTGASILKMVERFGESGADAGDAFVKKVHTGNYSPTMTDTAVRMYS